VVLKATLKQPLAKRLVPVRQRTDHAGNFRRPAAFHVWQQSVP
jgi:hypothetical protein